MKKAPENYSMKHFYKINNLKLYIYTLIINKSIYVIGYIYFMDTKIKKKAREN